LQKKKELLLASLLLTFGRTLLYKLGEDGDSTGLEKAHVQHLRRKLGDDARDAYWIGTIHGVGYRFIGPPIVIEDPREALDLDAGAEVRPVLPAG
jgi:hypothetical protein